MSLDLNEQLQTFSESFRDRLQGFHGNNSFFLFTLLLLHNVNQKGNLSWCSDIQLESAPLTLSGQLTSLTDKILVLHLNQLPIKLMALVLLHQTTPIPRKWSEVMSQSSFLILCNSIYLDFYITLTSEITGWDKHIFLVWLWSRVLLRANKESSNECVRVQLGHGYFSSSFQRQTLVAFQRQNSGSHWQLTFFCFLVRGYGVSLSAVQLSS